MEIRGLNHSWSGWCGNFLFHQNKADTKVHFHIADENTYCFYFETGLRSFLIIKQLTNRYDLKLELGWIKNKSCSQTRTLSWILDLDSL